MNDVRKEDLIRLSMQRELNAEEESSLESWLADHPEARGDWEEERALSRALCSLPSVSVSSNFTARVLQAVQLEQPGEARRKVSWWEWLRASSPRVGWGIAVLAVASLVFLGERITRQKDFRKAVVMLPVDFAKLPAPDALADFDAINQLRQASVTSDDELLKALQ